MKTKWRGNQQKITIVNRPVFLARTGELLQEGYTFPEAISLILPHHTADYEEVMEKIDEVFKRGLGASAVLERLGFSDTILLSVMIAEKNGRLEEVLGSLSAQLVKVEEAKKKFKNILAYPIVLFLFIGGLLIGFRHFFLPNMKALSVTREVESSFLSTILPTMVTMLPDIILGMLICSVGFVFGTLLLYRKCSPKNKIKFIHRLPIVRKWVFQWESQKFARELGSLLESGISIQDSLEILAGQHVDVLLSEIAKQVREHLIYGEPFYAAIGLTDGLTSEFSSFAKHGEASGHLAKELLIYSAHLEEGLHEKLSKSLSLLQPTLFSLIALCILAAYLALLLPIYNMLDTI